MSNLRWFVLAVPVFCALALMSEPIIGQDKKPKKITLEFPPKLPDGKSVITLTSKEFLKVPETIDKAVLIAKTPPTIDFLYYPGQDYQTKNGIWSNWGESLIADGKYYSSIGDHAHPRGNAFVYEYDPAKKVLRVLMNLAEILGRIMGYLPAKIHTRLGMGKDGWLYFATHRGSELATTDANDFKGDWILRCDPKSGKAEIITHAPVPKHAIPTGLLDPDRLIFYGGTVSGKDAPEKRNSIHFFAYDCLNRKLLYTGPNGPPRGLMFAQSTGKVYYVTVQGDMVGKLTCFDPAKKGAPYEIDAEVGLRTATNETPQGYIYTVSKGWKDRKDPKAGRPEIYAFHTKTETAKKLGPAVVGSAVYIATMSADPSGRYLYYVPGAHGGAEKDGSAVVQFDTKTGQRKVIAFLTPHLQNTIGAMPVGAFGSAVDPAGDKLYITWNVRRGSQIWDCCALTVIHIPESERLP